MSMKRSACFFLGTFLPFLRASERPIAIACLRLLTFLPLPLFKVPRFFLCMAPSTSLEALLLYRLIASSWANSTRSTRAGPRPGPASQQYGMRQLRPGRVGERAQLHPRREPLGDPQSYSPLWAHFF